MSTTSDNSIKRKFIISSFTVGLPLFHLIKNRNTIYRASNLMKEFYLKEFLARSVFGFFLGFTIATYLYGFGSSAK